MSVSFARDTRVTSNAFETCSSNLNNELIDFSSLPDAVPRVAFEDGGRLVRPSLSGSFPRIRTNFKYSTFCCVPWPSSGGLHCPARSLFGVGSKCAFKELNTTSFQSLE